MCVCVYSLWIINRRGGNGKERLQKKKKILKTLHRFVHTLDAIACNPTPGGAAVNFYRIFFRSVFLYLFFNVILFAREQTGGFFFFLLSPTVLHFLVFRYQNYYYMLRAVCSEKYCVRMRVCSSVSVRRTYLVIVVSDRTHTCVTLCAFKITRRTRFIIFFSKTSNVKTAIVKTSNIEFIF